MTEIKTQTAAASKNELELQLLDLLKDLRLEYTYKPGLSRCICGAPSWKQPCPSCGYYPMGRWDAPGVKGGQYETCKNTVTREKFVRQVEAAGGFGAFFMRESYGYSNCAYQSDYEFRARVDATIAKAKTMIWPDAGRMYDAFAAKFPAVK
jgi:hypothetical protein